MSRNYGRPARVAGNYAENPPNTAYDHHRGLRGCCMTQSPIELCSIRALLDLFACFVPFIQSTKLVYNAFALAAQVKMLKLQTKRML